jgi:Dynamin family
LFVTTEGEPVSAPPETFRHRPDTPGQLIGALTQVRDTVAGTRYLLRLADAERATATATAMVRQLDDYLLPRLRQLDAPLLVVVGGSTGAGKSTLVNSLVGAPVSPAGVLRPTTRAPVLVCHPADAAWFASRELLPGLIRTSAAAEDPYSLQIVTAAVLEPGLALLDAPDIDSVVDTNRALAAQLLAAADLWLFVTTAARYADAVPWKVLREARDRGTAIALVLDRVPDGAAEAVTGHLTAMLTAQELAEVPLFVLPETRLDAEGLIPARLIGGLGDWLSRLARSAAARAEVVRQTVQGAITALSRSLVFLAAAAQAQVTALESLTTSVDATYRGARSVVEHGVRDGVLLRGEVLARWQELVGTGEMMRALQARIGRLRDRIAAAVTGRTAPGEKFTAALESGIVALGRSAAADAAEQAAAAWRQHPAGAALLEDTDLGSPAPDLPERLERAVRDWQRNVLELVRREGGNKRTVARVSAYAVNATGLLVMIAVFAATSFIPTGAEIAVAGGTTVAAQKVLEAIFGDQAVRALADRARVDLLDRLDAVYRAEAARFTAVLDDAGVDHDMARRLRSAADRITAARTVPPLAIPDGGNRR